MGKAKKMSDVSQVKLFRSEKTTRNGDDLKVMMIGSIISLIILLGVPVWGKAYDKYFAERPFVSATLEISFSSEYDKPILMYDADAKQPVKAFWIVTIRDHIGNRITSRRGMGNYSTIEDGPKPWPWDAFFDNETGVPSPLVPKKPFSVCLRYESITRDTLVEDETPEICTPQYSAQHRKYIKDL